jgi:geranyl-CoA carboxylase alpha subunit
VTGSGARPDGLVVRPFGSVLVANRGEIACRVLRSAAAAGLRTVAVYSDADAGAPHVALADTAVRLGPAPARSSYLSVEALLAAAAATGAEAVHPGYGFLAEDAGFARACGEAGLVWIGPPPDVIALMGDKAAAKRRMASAGVPLLDGYDGEDQADARLLAEAGRIGVPLMVKAAAGGGGKGMRLVDDLAALPQALAAARREAAAAFGRDDLLLERALARPRHVEVQVLGDVHGTVVALGDRDCSVQRRHQKVVEEAPAPHLEPAVRAAVRRAGLDAARAVGYVGAGTVELLVDADGTVAFLEVNTRLQVEHPVTELVTGVDLVDLQLRVAAGEPLPPEVVDATVDGHAIEVRLYAEDPAAGYLPRTGPVAAWRPPAGAGVRVDAGVAAGGEVTAHYDPLLAKLVARGRDREEARRRLLRAVEATVLLGPRTNRALLAAVLDDPGFAAGGVTTAFLADRDLATPAPVEPRQLAAVAGWLHLRREAAAAVRSPGLAGWSSSGTARSRQLLRVDRGAGEAEAHDVVVTRSPDGLAVEVAGRRWAIAAVAAPSPGGSPARAADELVEVDGIVVRLAVVEVADPATGGQRWLVRLPRLDLEVVDVLLAPPAEASRGGDGVLVAPMHGAVAAVPVAVGDPVAAGDPVVVVEAMKMEHVVVADVGGTLAEVVAVGARVAGGQVVARIAPADPTPGGGSAG